MKKMSLIGLVILLIALLVGGPVMAQGGGMGEMNCNGLSEADCQILKDSAQMTHNIHSFTIPAWAIDLSLEAGPESIVVEGSGSGTVVLPEFLMAWASEMPTMTSPTDFAPVIDLLQQVDVAFVERLLAETGLQLTVDHAALQAPGQMLSGSVDLIFKDSILYVRLDSPSGAEAWFGEEVALTDSDREDLMQSLQDMLTQLQSEEFQESVAQMSELTGVYDEMLTIVNQYITTTRNADAELMGQTMYTFTTTFDVKGLLADPELPGAVLRLLQNPAMAALDMDTEDLGDLNETQVQFVLMTANLLIKQANYSFEQWIGADDQFVHKMVASLVADVDLSLLGENTGMESIAVNGDFSVEIDEINTATMDAVTPPAEYLPMDDTNDFLFGDAGMIEDELQLGQTFSGSFTDEDDEQDIFSVTLTAGQPVVFDLQSEDYPYLYLYSPDGFLVEEFDLYESNTHPFTAEQDGVYLIKVQAYWDLVYDLTVRP